MIVVITLPDGKKPATVSVEGNTYKEYEYLRSSNRVRLNLPPFHAKDTQKIAITFVN